MAARLDENTPLTFKDQVQRVYAFVLLSAYGIFLCSYFIFDEFSDPYRFFARVVFVLGLFVFARGIRGARRHPLFLVTTVYMGYLLVSCFWSDPLDWYRLGQKFTISVYLLSFFATTYYLVNWNQRWFERMLQICILFAAVSALASIVIFYSDKPFPATRLLGTGSLTNINEFANVYGVFALVAMTYAMRSSRPALKTVFMLAVVAFICVAWFGQSRTAFTAISIALLALVVLTLQRKKKMLYLSVLTVPAILLLILSPDVVEQAWHRGQGLRPDIWTHIWKEVMAAPYFGHGFASTLSIEVDEHVMETAHSAYLQVLWHAGVVGLVVFLFLLGTLFRYAWLLGRREGDYTIFCILLFAALTMMTGVDSLIDRPRDQWMLFWFPLALLLSYPTPGPAAQAAPALAATNRPDDFADGR